MVCGVKMQDVRCKMSDARCQMPDARCKMPDARCRMQGPNNNRDKHKRNIDEKLEIKARILPGLVLVYSDV